jgi:hypothetical protein
MVTIMQHYGKGKRDVEEQRYTYRTVCQNKLLVHANKR